MQNARKLWVMQSGHSQFHLCGQQLAAAAKRRGWDARLFSADTEWNLPDEGYAYTRIAQWPPFFQREKERALKLANKGLTLIPEPTQIRLYETKIAQARAYTDFMPKTIMFSERQKAEAAIGDLGFPFISKADFGSGSRQVRVISNAAAARREIEMVWGRGYPPTRRGQAQRGYVYWQEFCPDNKFDYRAHIIGRDRAICKRWNRPGTLFASGTNKVDNIDPNGSEAGEIFEFIDQLVKRYDFRYCCLDVVKGADGEWKFLETSIGWSSTKPSWLNRIFRSGRRCCDLADVVMGEIEDGVFDGTN